MDQLALALDAAADVPLFLQIFTGLRERIVDGRLGPGAKLPGSRSLATSLAVHRNTVLAAYRELDAQGWITTRRGAGTFVAGSIPPRVLAAEGDAPPAAPEAPRGFDLPPRALLALHEPRARWDLGGGLPDLRLAPLAELGRAYRRVLTRDGKRLLDYGHPQGSPALRGRLAAQLARRRGLRGDAGRLVLTRGSQMGLYLIAQLLLRPGDAVAVEALGYPPAWQALRAAGARLCPVPVDEQGIDVAALERLLAREPIRLVYVTPHHQFPTMAVLDAGRRLALLRLAARHRCAIVEDDYTNEFSYEGRPVLPLASEDPAGVVLYVGTLSKILAPALRLGWVEGPREVVEGLARLRLAIDRQGDRVGEAVVTELFATGVLERHAQRMRRCYHRRRDALGAALERELGGRLRFRLPPGGMALWAELTEPRDIAAWARRAQEREVFFQQGRTYRLEPGEVPCIRLGFTRHDPAEIDEAVRRLAEAWD